MVEVNELRSLIYRDYKSISKFALAAGIDRHVVYKVLNRVMLPDAKEISLMGRALNMSSNQVTEIFLSDMSPNDNI